METMTTKSEVNNNLDVYSQLRAYNGENSFILSLKSSLLRYGKLTDKQYPYAAKFFREQQQFSTTGDNTQTPVEKKYPSYNGGLLGW